MKKLLLSLSLSVAALFSAAAADQFVKVTDASTLKAGDEIIIVNEGKSSVVALGAQNGTTYRDKVDVNIANDAILVDSEPVTVITLEESGNANYPWLFNTADGYLYSPNTGKNYCNVTKTATTKGTNINVTITNGKTSVTCNQTTKNVLSYNTSTPRFAFYASLQNGGDLTIFAKVAEVTVDPIDYTALPAEVTLMAGENKMLADKYPTDILFESSDESVVTVSDEGMLTAIAAGEATITAIWGGDKVYTEGEAEIKVVVTEYVQPLEVTFDFVNNYIEYGFEPTTSSNFHSDAPEVEISTGNVTINVNSKWALWDNGKTFRCYKDAELTFTAPAEYDIVKIAATFDTSSGSNSYSGLSYAGKALEGAWEGKEAMVSLDVTAKVYFKNITVTLEKIGGSGDDPVADPLDFTFTIMNDKNEAIEGAIGTKGDDEVKVFFDMTNAEGIEIFFKLEESAEVETLANEPEEGFTAYNKEEGVVIPANYNGSLSYYAQDETTGAKTEVMTTSVDSSKATSGVEAIEIDAANGAVEYFNLQGVRVDAPTAGLYIARQGQKVMKVVIR